MIEYKWENWVALALPEDDSCDHHRMWIDDGWLRATDIHRLHVMKTLRRTGVLKSLSGGYIEFSPEDIDQHRPKGTDGYLNLELDFTPLRFGDIERGRSEYRVCRIGGRVYNYNYILDVFEGSDEMGFCFHEGQEVGVFESTDKRRRAYVKPLKKETEFYGFRA